jgi:hypothetical protein
MSSEQDLCELKAKTEGLASELEEIMQELQQPRDLSPDPSHSALDDSTNTLIQAKYLFETFKEYLESETQKRLIKRLDDLTLSMQPPEKPSAAPLPPMPQHGSSAIRDGDHVRKWIFKTEDTVADRAHTRFKAIEAFMIQYYMPEGGPYARSLEHFARRFVALEDILQKAKLGVNSLSACRRYWVP